MDTPRIVGGRRTRRLSTLICVVQTIAVLASPVLAQPSAANARRSMVVITSARQGPADSIVHSRTMRGVRAANDLPRTFAVLDEPRMRSAVHRSRCALHLLDERDSTLLTLRESIRVHAPNVAGRDSSEATVEVGLYSVEPLGRYGAGRRQRLRVTCLS